MNIDTNVGKFLVLLMVIVLILAAESLIAGFFDKIYKRVQTQVVLRPEIRKKTTIVMGSIAVILLILTFVLLLP